MKIFNKIHKILTQSGFFNLPDFRFFWLVAIALSSLPESFLYQKSIFIKIVFFFYNFHEFLSNLNMQWDFLPFSDVIIIQDSFDWPKDFHYAWAWFSDLFFLSWRPDRIQRKLFFRDFVRKMIFIRGRVVWTRTQTRP